MNSRAFLATAVLSLTLAASAFGAAYDVIAPKSQKAAEKKQSLSPQPEKAATPFAPTASGSATCPEETDWLLTTLPLTTGEKSDASFSKGPGGTFLPEDMQQELINIAAKEGISMKELCSRLKGYKTRLEEYSGDSQEYNRQRMLILEEMLDCRKSCGKILNRFAGLYTESSKVYFSGIVRFNRGSAKVEADLKGDRSHGYIRIKNDEQLKTAFTRWSKDPSQRIQLDARSSIPGTVDMNDRISKIRAEMVMNWLVAKGVPAERISIRWLGKYGPLIEKNVAKAYNIENIYNEYVNSKAKQTASLIGSQGFNSFFDGLNQSVSIFVLP